MLKPKNIARIIFYSGFLMFVGIKSIEAYRNHDAFNGFDVSNSLLPVDQIHRGGPPRDGIPAIDSPKFLIPDQQQSIAADSRVLGVLIDDQARAYPISILNWHEIVNERFGQQNITITYCPLCGTGMAFAANDGQTFGVSGLLYNNDMLLYDRETESLWSQIKKMAISGPRKGEKLKSVPLLHTNWQSWKQAHPGSLILSRETGYQRKYDESPYLGYASSDELYFPAALEDKRYATKESVIGLTINKQQKVWPFSELHKTTSPVKDSIAGINVIVHFNKQQDHAWITDEQGKLLAAVRGYWFAWINFHPDSQVFTAR